MFIPRFNFSCFVYMAIVFFSNQAIAQQSTVVEEINSISYRNFSSYYHWDKREIRLKGRDTLEFIPSITVKGKGFYLGKPNRILLGSVVAMNQLRQGNLYVLVFYFLTDSGKIETKSPYTFENSDSITLLMQAFNRLFLENGHPIPPLTCPAYEIDLLAQKFTIRPLESDLPHPRAYRYSMDSVVEGYFALHYLNGNLRLERNVKNGMLNGIQCAYFENGKLVWEASYHDGLQVGEELNYFESGGIASKRSFVNGLEHGASIQYWENGQVNQRTIMDMGKMLSEEDFNEDGSPQE